MSKRKIKRAWNHEEKSPGRVGSRRRVMILVSLLIGLLLTGGALAQWTGILSIAQKNKRRSGGEIAPASFPANSPAKEYIYAGGRLIATEEPAAAGCANPPTAPTSLLATATSTTSVSLTWPASSGAVHHYEVERKNNISSQYTVVNSNVSPATPTVTVPDTGLAVNTAYLYRVRAFDAAGCSSPYSPVDLATTIIFSETVAAGVLVKASHITELFTAVNAVRATAGLAAFNWSDTPAVEAPAISGLIRKEHVQKLRDKLDLARSALGLPPQSYTNQPLTVGTIVQAAHIQQLRDGVK